MKILQSSTLGLLTLIITNLYPIRGNTQIFSTGNCVVQINNSDSNVVNLTCYSASGLGFGEPISVPIQTTVSDLRKGNKTFSIIVENQSSSAFLELSWKRFQIIDNQGNYYPIDDFASSFGSGLTRTIPPGQSIRLDYVLESPISPNATSVTFTNSSLWAQPANSQFSEPLQNLSWITYL